MEPLKNPVVSMASPIKSKNAAVEPRAAVQNLIRLHRRRHPEMSPILSDEALEMKVW